MKGKTVFVIKSAKKNHQVEEVVLRKGKLAFILHVAIVSISLKRDECDLTNNLLL